MNLTLYKYMSAEYAMSSIEKKRVKVSMLTEMNDPYEMVPSIVDSVGSPVFSSAQVRSTLFDKIAPKHGFICTSKTMASPLLWSHYSDKHKGMALVFNYPEDSSIIEVQYRRDRVSINIGNDSDYLSALERAFPKLLCTKYDSWSYEKEVRFLIELKPINFEDNLYWQLLSGDIFVGVILGCLCPEKEKDIHSLLVSAGFPNAHVSRAVMDPIQYRMILQQAGAGYPPQGVGSPDP